ncbi:hypothetical protein UPYG_G00191200 [Umbra pygmaea]|uniref:EGF-like domain-containing protein n=1 Tax=Umbra pygmaea TaxID=75934 RepID=A0ABD0XDR6_UMBPY
MSTQRQTVRASTLLAVAILIHLAGTQSADPQGNLEPTKRTVNGAESTVPVNGSEMEKPHVLTMSKSCRGKDTAYCMHGQCMYPTDIDTPACKCHPSYSGERCNLLSHETTLNELTTMEEVIAICVGVALFLGCFAIILYCFIRKRCEKLYSPYKTYASTRTSV